jgi:polar amino acid transport system substrate-binding protein
MLGLTGSTIGASTAPRSRPGPSLETCKTLVRSETVATSKLTVATNDPALAPWFQQNNPGNGRGYESAVTYQIASVLGYKSRAVAWFTEPFELATNAGSKPFDFDINEITYAHSLTKLVSLSAGYFNVNESLVALKTNRIVKQHTPRELRSFVYGALTGSPGLSLLTSEVKPTTAPSTFSTLADAVSALTAKRIDAIMIDTPTGQYLTSQQLPQAVQFAQFHTTGQHYVLLFQKGNELLACVNSAIRYLNRHGELASLSKKYLSVYNAIRFISP